jgi:3-oxoadipate enol-lactonase
MPNAELVVISGAAHGFMVEHATTFNRVLFEFLGRVEKARRSATDAGSGGMAATG